MATEWPLDDWTVRLGNRNESRIDVELGHRRSEQLGNFLGIRYDRRQSAPNPDHKRRDHIAGSRHIVVQPTENIRFRSIDGQFLVELPDCGLGRRLAIVDLSSWQCELSGMRAHPIRTFRE